MIIDGQGYWARRRLSRRRLLTGGAGALGVVSLGLAGCTTTPAAVAPAATSGVAAAPAASSPAAAGASATPAPKLGGTIRTGTTAAERNQDPQMLNGGDGSMGAGACYNQLLTFKFGPDVPPPSYIVTADLAESWTQPDDLTYIFKLRQGVKWHNIPPVNGRELVADDILYSYDRTRELKSNASFLQGIVKQEAVDKSTVKLTLDKPNADVLINLASYLLKIVAKEAVAVNGDLANGPTIGTGPWIQTDFTPMQRFVAKKNPDYFIKGQPYADSLDTIRAAGGDATLLIKGFQSGSLDILGGGGTPEVIDQLLAVNSKFRVVWIALNRSPDEIALNTRFQAFANKKVRQAIRKAIDWNALLGTMNGRASIGSGLSLPSTDWDLPADELKMAMTRDVAGARSLLREAGMESGFDFKLTAPNYVANHYVSMAEIVQANLKEVNLRATLDPVDGATFQQRAANGQYDAYVGVFGLGATNSTLYGRYYTGGPQNYFGYASPDLDKLIDQQATQARDPDARKRTLQQIARIVVDDCIVMNIMARHQPYATWPYVEGWNPNTEPIQGQYHWNTVWFNK
jgi:peptide/nickel transport system substrate-binding protein